MYVRSTVHRYGFGFKKHISTSTYSSVTSECISEHQSFKKVTFLLVPAV
jgi:hypothetical protein